MQIKSTPTDKKAHPASLMKQWLMTTIPFITGIIVLPYLFIFLSCLYAHSFQIVTMQTLQIIAGIQGVLILSVPVITAGIMFVHISRHLRTMYKYLATVDGGGDKRGMLSDEWLTIEKQKNQLGETAKLIKKISNDNHAAEPNQPTEQAENDMNRHRIPLEALYAIAINQPEPQCYYSLD